jgi:hypothetical protein
LGHCPRSSFVSAPPSCRIALFLSFLLAQAEMGFARKYLWWQRVSGWALAVPHVNFELQGSGTPLSKKPVNTRNPDFRPCLFTCPRAAAASTRPPGVLSHPTLIPAEPRRVLEGNFVCWKFQEEASRLPVKLASCIRKLALEANIYLLRTLKSPPTLPIVSRGVLADQR